MTYETINVSPATTHIGAEISNVDLSGPLDNKTWDEIHQAFAAHSVIYFRDQDISVDNHIAFAEKFGKPEEPKKLPKYSPDYPTVSLIENDGTKAVVGNRWHSDNSDYREPPLGAAMYAEVIPETGGDTLFASMYAAYDALSDRMKDILDGATALHDNTNVQNHYKGANVIVQDGMTVDEPSEHPVVRTHPVTGRKALFVNAVYTQSIVGFNKNESDTLLAMLFTHVQAPDFAFRLRWQAGTLTLWDNRCVQHYASSDYLGHRRMRRVVVEGDRPY